MNSVLTYSNNLLILTYSNNLFKLSLYMICVRLGTPDFGLVESLIDVGDFDACQMFIEI